MKSPKSCGRTIVSCMVLHNLTVDIGDDTVLIDREDPYLGFNYPNAVPVVAMHNAIDRRLNRDNLKRYLACYALNKQFNSLVYFIF